MDDKPGRKKKTRETVSKITRWNIRQRFSCTNSMMYTSPIGILQGVARDLNIANTLTQDPTQEARPTDHPDCMAPTGQRELDHIDHTRSYKSYKPLSIRGNT